MRETQLDAWDLLQPTVSDKRAKVFSVIKKLNGFMWSTLNSQPPRISHLLHV